MSTIRTLTTDFFHVPLPVALTDRLHGEMRHFELVTVRARSCHGAHDVTVHLLAAVPNCSYLEAHGFGLDRFLAHPLAIVDGHAAAPDRPGHGVEFDWQALEPLRVRGVGRESGA